MENNGAINLALFLFEIDKTTSDIYLKNKAIQALI